MLGGEGGGGGEPGNEATYVLPMYVCSLSCCSAIGSLKGYDQLLNLVLDGTVEFLQGQLSF